MPTHDGQLRLTPETPGTEPVVVDVRLPDRVVKLLRRLTAGGALAFATRAPEVLQDLLEEIIAVGQLTSIELDQRLRRRRADVARLTAEQERRRAAARDPDRFNDDPATARGYELTDRPARAELVEDNPPEAPEP